MDHLVYHGEAHLRHYVPATPGPAKYEQARNRSSFGKQVLTKPKHAPSYSFGSTSRFGYIDNSMRRNKTPGPGEYVN